MRTTTMAPKIAPAALDAEVPLSGTAELIVENISRRREELAQHNPAAVRAAARVYAAIYQRVWGRMSQLAGATSARMLRLRVMAQRSMAIEDWIALGFESPEGHAAAVDALREAGAALGQRVIPDEGAAPRSAHVEMAELSALTGATLHRALKDLEDGRIDDWPALRGLFAQLKEQVLDAEAACDRAQGHARRTH